MSFFFSFFSNEANIDRLEWFVSSHFTSYCVVVGRVEVFACLLSYTASLYVYASTVSYCYFIQNPLYNLMFAVIFNGVYSYIIHVIYFLIDHYIDHILSDYRLMIQCNPIVPSTEWIIFDHFCPCVYFRISGLFLCQVGWASCELFTSLNKRFIVEIISWFL